MLARVTANEIKANFIWVKVRNFYSIFNCTEAHDCFFQCPQLVVGGTDATVVLENEFKKAKAMEPCIVFLEEFECIAQVKGKCCALSLLANRSNYLQQDKEIGTLMD